jgi:hypothetical protein
MLEVAMISEPITFLANIILIAHADGNLSPVELQQIELIRNELNMGKGDLKEASKLVEQANYALTPIGSFADQVRNFEMMFRVACCDNNLEKTEGSILIEFCKSIGLTRDQVNIIKADVLSLLKQQSTTCPSCGATITLGAKFCGKCGINFTNQVEKTQIEIKIPSTGLVIEFAESTSASFSEALELAKESEGFRSYKKNKKRWFLAVYSSKDMMKSIPLAGALKTVRKREVYIDGEKKTWDVIFGFVKCVLNRSKSYNPEEYCFGKDSYGVNPWGCINAHMGWVGWESRGLWEFSWFQYGSWEKTDTLEEKVQWRFDKKKIRHNLNKNLHRFQFCPHLKMELCELVIKLLPETIVPDSEPQWQYCPDYSETPGRIRVKDYEDEDGYINEIWAHGVVPEGPGVLEDILSRAFKEIGISSTTVKKILE